MRRVLLSLMFAGCAESIRPDHLGDAGAIDVAVGNDAITPTGKVTTVPRGDGSSTTLVDASSMTDWIHLDFDTAGELDATGPWELRFQRFHISTQAGVEVAPVADRAFADVTESPATGWRGDADVDGDTVVDYAFDQGDGWYDYDDMTHVLTPKPIVWVVRAGATQLKLELLDYYDPAGTSGWLTFHWGTL